MRISLFVYLVVYTRSMRIIVFEFMNQNDEIKFQLLLFRKQLPLKIIILT